MEDEHPNRRQLTSKAISQEDGLMVLPGNYRHWNGRRYTRRWILTPKTSTSLVTQGTRAEIRSVTGSQRRSESPLKPCSRVCTKRRYSEQNCAINFRIRSSKKIIRAEFPKSQTTSIGSEAAMAIWRSIHCETLQQCGQEPGGTGEW